MKKLVMLLTSFLVLTSCNKDDENTANQTIKVTTQSIAGKWYPSKVIKADGTTVDYVQNCASYKDFMEFFQYRAVTVRFGHKNCVDIYTDETCSDFNLNEETSEISFCSFFSKVKLSLTSTTLRLDFDSPRTTNYGNIQDAKALILTKA